MSFAYFTEELLKKRMYIYKSLYTILTRDDIRCGPNAYDLEARCA